jgi:hypothetical protein
MLKRCLGIALTAIVLSDHSAIAQSYAETALLFSRTPIGGSARIQGVGGAQIALGGDYSSALSNPAGLGMFNRSEITFSPALSFYKANTGYDTKSNLGASSTEESTSKFNIPGVSYVMHLPKDNNGFLGGSFGFSFSRTNDFNSSILYSGENTQTSIVDYFLEQANGAPPSQFDGYHAITPTGLAYQNYLIGPTSIIDPDNGSDEEYFTDAPIRSLQHEEIRTSGSSNQWSLSYGGNYKDMFFFGGGIGLTTLRYTSEKFYQEQYRYDNGDDEPIDRMELSESLDLRGSGINATLGVIVRPVEYFQAGISFTSPTFYQITENYNGRMKTYWNNYPYDDGQSVINLNDESASTGPVNSEYNLTTPLKLGLGVAFISKFGFITADIERTNPAKSKYTSDIQDISYAGENREIKDLYKAVFNYRFGAEYRHGIARVRLGYGIQSSTYQNNALKNKIVTLSGGAGIRLKKFSIDAAVIATKKDKAYYSPYNVDNGTEPLAEIAINNLTTMLTFGFRL